MIRITRVGSRASCLTLGMLSTLIAAGCGPSALSEQRAVEALGELGVLVVKNHTTGFVSAVNVSVIRDKRTVSDALRQIATLSRLQSLNVSNVEVRDDDLSQIGKMTSLIELNLSMTNLSDDGMNHLVGLTKLNTLYVAETTLTDRGMEWLDRFSNLKVIGLSRTAIKEPLVALKKLKHIQWVDLSAMEVSDEILRGLGDVESLETVSLENATYSPSVLDELKKTRRDIEFKL